MNKRIKELAEQAFCYSCEFAQGPDYNPHNPYNLATQQTRYDSKFAELIVKECVDMLMLEHAEAKGQHNYYHVTANKLKKHFGVEE